MKFYTTLLVFAIMCTSLRGQSKLPTHTATLTRYGITLTDTLAWMDDMESEKVKKWSVKQDNETTKQHQIITKKISTEQTIKIYAKKRPKTIPLPNGVYFFKMMYKELKSSASLFLYKSLQDDSPKEIIDPNKIYPSKNVEIDQYKTSRNSTHLAYSIRINGSDKLEILFYDFKTNKGLNDTIRNVKFSALSWNKNEGVFYKRNSNRQKFERDSTSLLYYHKLNSNSTEDYLVYDGTNKDVTFSYFTSSDKLFLIVKDLNSPFKQYFFANLEDPEFKLIPFRESTDSNFELINFKKGRIYYSTQDFNWGEVRSFSLLNPEDDKQIIPQFYNQLLENVSFSDDYLICKYRYLNKNYFSIYDYDGNFIKKIQVPDNIFISLIGFKEETQELYFNVKSITLPIKTFKANIISGNLESVHSLFESDAPTLFPIDYFETKYTTFTTSDQKQVPIVIVHKKGMNKNGNAPTLLETYGGYGTLRSAKYDEALLHFLDKGGVYAYAEIRGGGEKGSDWANEGRGLNKINGLRDFIEAAEYLIRENYTNPSKLAISGASHGGFVIGYALTERPELFKLAIPVVGAFDLINHDKFTVGKYQYEEYGNPNTEEGFKSLLSLSPLHRIKYGVNYPTTLIITSDNDDRVPPVHSYKFAWALQNRPAQRNPVFLRVRKEVGHYGENTFEKFIEQKAEFYDFLFYYLSQ